MLEFILNLQFFGLGPGAGGNVNATTAMVNANDGTVTSRGGNNGDANYMAAELKDYYDTELLENTRAELFYAQFGKRQPLPAHHNGVVEWRKWKTFPRADQLVEAVIPKGKDFGMSKLTGQIYQYGMFTAISDKLELRAFDDIILGATEEMGASAAETQEALIRNALYAGTNVLYCDEITVATGAFHAAPPINERGMVYDGTYGNVLTPAMVNKAVTIMKKNRVPRINNKYYAVIHPSVAHDLRQSDEWIEVHKYAATEQIFNGEIGELHGCRFIENTFAPVFKQAGLAAEKRTLSLAAATTSGTAVTSLTFSTTGATVAAGSLVGRYISLNGHVVQVTANTTSTVTFASTDFGSNSIGATIYAADYGAGDIAAYATYFFGKDSFGIIDPEGGALQMIVHDKDEIGGPLNQFSTIGYKFESNGATILYPERVLRVMSNTSFSADDLGNL